MKRLRWIAGGVLGAAVALLVGFRVEMMSGGWPVSSLPEWITYSQPHVHLPLQMPAYSAPYWALAGFVVGALWIVLRERD
jgi:hypothetical protein